MRLVRGITLILFMTAYAQAYAAELNPGYPENIGKDGKEGESALRRGEVIFFTSYPFMFVASAAGYALFGYGIAALDGKSSFAPDGTFYAVSAISAAFLSFGIAMNDYYAIKAQTKANEGTPAGYLSLSFRF